jgi:hypothetical protein
MINQSLENEISVALAADAIIPAELEALIDKADDGIAAAKQAAARQRETALDPILSPDLREARETMDDAAILVGRLETLRRRLERRLAQVIDAEAHARWLQDYNEVIAKRDAAVAQFQRYPDLIVELLTILHTAQDVDAEVARVNHTAPPTEARRLVGVEATARGISAFSRLQPAIADGVVLPDLENADRTLWPPPPPVAIVPPPPADVRFSADWGRHRDEARQQAQDKAERDRAQFEADAEAGQSDGGRSPVWWKRNGTAE